MQSVIDVNNIKKRYKIGWKHENIFLFLIFVLLKIVFKVCQFVEYVENNFQLKLIINKYCMWSLHKCVFNAEWKKSKSVQFIAARSKEEKKRERFMLTVISAKYVVMKKFQYNNYFYLFVTKAKKVEFKIFALSLPKLIVFLFSNDLGHYMWAMN